MSFWQQYKSPLGYTNNNSNQIDSYGVDHSSFNTQDELQYQNARINRENNLMTHWIGSDNFFHCKANYEATKRGPWGELVGKAISTGREIWGQLFKNDPLSDMHKDWHANRMGWQGAKQGLTLEEACPTNPKAYVNPKDYNNIF